MYFHVYKKTHYVYKSIGFCANLFIFASAFLFPSIYICFLSIRTVSRALLATSRIGAACRCAAVSPTTAVTRTRGLWAPKCHWSLTTLGASPSTWRRAPCSSSSRRPAAGLRVSSLSIAMSGSGFSHCSLFSTARSCVVHFLSLNAFVAFCFCASILFWYCRCWISFSLLLHVLRHSCSVKF